jgi:large subunit ribosomal protein L37Ae
LGRTKKVGPAGSLGARYGTVARRRYTVVVSELRRPKNCPKCQMLAVRRESVGIWCCRKCGYKFTGGAYVPQTKLGEISRRGARAALVEAAAKQVAPAEKTEQPAAEEKPKRRARRRRKAEEAPTEQAPTEEPPTEESE